MLALLSVSAHGLSVPAQLASNPALAKTFRRAEFWDEGSATLLDLVNVLGRWQTSSQWSTRTEFIECDVREMTDLQAYSVKRYEMALRLGQVERVALFQNTAKLPFSDEGLAKGCGMTAKDFKDLALNPVAINIVFDALAQSKNSLLPVEVCDARRMGLVSTDGSLNEAAFSVSLVKARALVIMSWFVFGKGNLIGLLVLLKVVTDATGVGGNFFQARPPSLQRKHSGSRLGLCKIFFYFSRLCTNQLSFLASGSPEF